jgi:predicted PurR-regulated permease PerM
MTDHTPGPQPESPPWSSLTKFLASMVVIVLLGALIVRFQEMIGPLVLAFILAYLISPIIERITAWTKLSWGLVVMFIYVLLLLLLLTGFTGAVIAIGQQVKDLYDYLVVTLPDLRPRLETLTQQTIVLGPWIVDLSKPIPLGPFPPLNLSTIDWEPLYRELLTTIQPALTQTGTFVGTLASGTASLLGWLLFVLLISFYLLHDLKSLTPSLELLVPPPYRSDARRLAAELGPTWNAYLRGQVTVALTSFVVMSLILSVLNVRYAPVLGLLAFLSEFVPFVGPTFSGVVGVLIALFQPSNWLGLSPLWYAVAVALVYIVWQQIQNNIIAPRILSHSLKLHPVIILVGAIIAANLAGFVGLLLSAPLVATLRLFGRYIYCKIFDLDPWPEPTPQPAPPRKSMWPRWLQPLLLRFQPKAQSPKPEVQGQKSDVSGPTS